jgi:hypothetical protein
VDKEQGLRKRGHEKKLTLWVDRAGQPRFFAYLDTRKIESQGFTAMSKFTRANF